MLSEEFEDGREFERLTSQIQEIYIEIFTGSGKNDPAQRKSLVEVIQEVFPRYIELATKYQLNPSEIKRTSNQYKRTLEDGVGVESLVKQ